MKVKQIRVAGHNAWPTLGLSDLGPELTVLFGPPRTGKSTVARLAAHLLYGKIESPWRLEFANPTPLVEGSLDVACPQGAFVLRRHRDGSAHGRLTVASAAGAAVDGRTIRTLLGGLSPALLAELYVVDFAEGPRPQTLLEGEFARQFTAALSHEPADAQSAVCWEHAPSVAAPTVDRRRFDELAARRDDVVRQIEEQMSSRRRDSKALEAELAQVETTINNRRAQAEELATRLHAVESKLAELAARLRYFALETEARSVRSEDGEALRTAIERLDPEIARCRQMLADLQSREANVRRELAEVHPDGTADSVGGLAEQRATVGVLERLVDDLDAEVAGLARSHEPGRCIAADAHARMLPVAQMLRQQVYALCGQVTEQERSVRRIQLRAELRQLARAQSDLSEQLEHLLQRRQELSYESQSSGRVAATPPATPVAGHCRCERHDDFLRNADEALLGRGRVRLEEDARTQRNDLEGQRRQLRESGDAVARELASLTTRWETLQQERAGAAGRVTLDELRAELERLEAELNRVLRTSAGPLVPMPAAAGAAGSRRVWKASDALAQLTGGQLTQIRISREGRAATIVDREGRLLVIDDLSPQQNDQLHLALVLALTSSLAQRGVELPVVLDEPFLRQDAAASAAMCGVLAEFAHEGRQVIVCTQDRESVRRLESLGVDVRDLDAARRTVVEPTPAVPKVVAATEREASVRVVREPAAGGATGLRLAGHRASTPVEKPQFYLTVDASLADFPVLGNDTAIVFSSLGIRTVEDLLAADAADVARRLAHPAVAADAVRLWQQHMSLMCFVPGVSLADAQVLAACEATSPEALFTIDVRLLAEAITRFLGTERGRRFTAVRERFTRDRLATLQKQARRQRDRWQLLSPRYAWVERSVEPTRKAPKVIRALRRERKGIGAKPKAVGRLTKPGRDGRELRFLLAQTSAVADAPSIGGKMAKRLAMVGIRTVADLLHANPESTAQELDQPRVNAATISRWQAEARLACRIPELRSCGAQLLVACGLTEPEQVAGAQTAELVAKVRAVSRTSAGRRILRGGEAPSAARVAAWIRHAAHMRPIEAA